MEDDYRYQICSICMDWGMAECDRCDMWGGMTPDQHQKNEEDEENEK